MNRHHPYGGSFDGHRRGGSPSVPGPDRAHRFQERSGGGYRGRGGYGRGRAGGRGGGGEYGAYEGGIPGGYDQGSDMDAYNEYDSQAPPQNSFYQNTGPYASYNQGYGKYEGALTLKIESALARTSGAIRDLGQRFEAHGNSQTLHDFEWTLSA